MIPLTQEQIESIFERAEHQADYTLGLYKFVYPDWDEIKSVDGYPQLSKATNEFIFKLAIAFDKVNHPKVMPGGMWMSNGFGSADPEIADWTIKPAPVTK